MSRWTAQNFIRVADKLEDKWVIFHHLPVSILYELASPSTSEEIMEQAPPVVGIKEIEKQVVPPEVTAQIESLQQRLYTSTQQRDTLVQQVTQLGEEA